MSVLYQCTLNVLVCVCVCVPQVDTAAQIPWYERLSEFKLPWEIKGDKQMVINKLSLRVCSGQMLAIIGSSGKTQTHMLHLSFIISDQGQKCNDLLCR